MVSDQLFWAPQAWLGQWRESVLLRVENGHWAEVTPGVPAPAGATVLAGPVLPGMVNAHSHAFQRAFAGLAEYRTEASDDFWTWRDRMYRVALKVGPEAMRAVAVQLYAELLLGGYTQVCEFHYLHRQADGTAYDDPLAMSWALAESAATVGLGMTLIPVIYERAGFDQPKLRDDQRPFTMSATQAWDAYREIDARKTPLLTAAVGAHSLRAARPESIRELLRLAKDFAGPLHMHAAEQTGEVDACVKTTGTRPLEWLAREGVLDSRWHLVHATHSIPSELDAVANSGAGVVLCPNTEGNLGDGFCDLLGLLSRDISLAIGSDSQITRDWPGELRMLEYAQRLKHRQRCLASNPPRQASSGERLFAKMLAGGAKAAGFAKWGLVAGARADLLVLDATEPALLGVPTESRLDAAIYSSPARPIKDVIVNGQWVVRDGQHAAMAASASRFEAAMAALWA